MIFSLVLSLVTFASKGSSADIVCPAGRSSPQTVTVGSGQTVGFRTQQGEIYGKNTKCKVNFKRDSSCPSLVVSCPIFDVPHAQETCIGPPDYLLLGNQRFCQKSGPKNFSSSSSKLTLGFVSNRVFEGEGAECSIACSDVPPAANEDTCFDCGGLARELEQIKQICQQAPSHPFEGQSTPSSISMSSFSPGGQTHISMEASTSAESSVTTTGTTSAPFIITWAFGMNEALECVRPGTLVVFKWGGSFHNVDKVGSADDYANCNGITDTAGASGPYKWIAPTNEGRHYFVCGVGIHCSAGNMKATIEVSNNCP